MTDEISWEPVIVVWIDAFTDSGCTARKVAATYEPCRRRSIGFLVHEDDDRVVIAMEDDREGMVGDSSHDCDTVTTIPRAIVEKIIRLRPTGRAR